MWMQLDLGGKVALVTGGGRGIGRAVCHGLAREGARVGVLARTRTEVEQVAADIVAAGGRALPLPCDLTSGETLDVALAALERGFGPPTILVHSAAAYYEVQKLHDVAPADARALLALDIDATVALLQRVLPGMMLARWGRIVGIGSLAARAGVSGGTLYAGAKAALEGLCRGVALDYARRGVTANVVAVGFADTGRLASRIAGREEHRRLLERATARRTLPTPDEIADVVIFLCSARAGAVTGAVVDVTAGAHLNTVC
jgi:NAD(P)-dependent dehydrogenase (short-subunit alcohol dehydrogenase family)